MVGMQSFSDRLRLREQQVERQLLPLIDGRGLRVSKYNLPSALFEKFPQMEKQFRKFYSLFHHYSTRLIWHDLHLNAPDCHLSQLTHYASPEKVAEVLNHLKATGVIGSWTEERIPVNIPGELPMGWWLEWFVATVLSLEFASPSIFNVGLRGTASGGDYDVLSAWLGKLLYVETKSAPPRGIHNPEIGAFLERVRELKPDLAVFLNDTHLRVKDKIVLMFEEEFIKLKGIEALQNLPVERVQEQIFQIGHYIYIMNTKRDIRKNFKVVFQDYLKARLPINRIFK